MRRRIVSRLAAMLPSPATTGEREARYTTEDGAAAEGSFSQAVANVCDGGTILLQADVKTNEALCLSGKTVTLLGEGRRINLKSGFTLRGNAVLHLGRENYDKTLTIWSSGAAQALFRLRDNARMNLYAHVTLGPSSATGTTGGVQISEAAEFTMYGGTISDCHSASGASGAVAITDSGIFRMKGGLIENCAGVGGGAVSLHPKPAAGGSAAGHAVFQMEGGTIRSWMDKYCGGSTVCVDPGEQAFTLSVT